MSLCSFDWKILCECFIHFVNEHNLIPFHYQQIRDIVHQQLKCTSCVLLLLLHIIRIDFLLFARKPINPVVTEAMYAILWFAIQLIFFERSSKNVNTHFSRYFIRFCFKWIRLNGTVERMLRRYSVCTHKQSGKRFHSLWYDSHSIFYCLHSDGSSRGTRI